MSPYCSTSSDPAKLVVYPSSNQMRTPAIAAHLQAEAGELFHSWELGQHMLRTDCPSADDHQALVYAALALLIPDGMERLRMAWVLDRSVSEELAAAKTAA